MNIGSTTKSLALACAFVIVPLTACSSAQTDSNSTSEGLCSEAYDWHDFTGPNQCVGGMEAFYAKHFGAASAGIPLLGPIASNGACENPGACLLWVDDLPDPSHWVRMTGTPQLFDMMVYPPDGSNHWGHVAVVDHVSGGQVFVMDDNYEGPLNAGQKAGCPHTVSWPAYGFYRLKILAGGTPPSPDCSERSGWNCGDDGVINGNPNTNYDCEYGRATPLQTEACAYGCKIMPNGVADVCNPPPAPDCANRSGWNCGNDGVINGNADTNYYCNYGQVAPVEAVVCTYGCVVMPNGVADHCQAK